MSFNISYKYKAIDAFSNVANNIARSIQNINKSTNAASSSMIKLKNSIKDMSATQRIAMNLEARARLLRRSNSLRSYWGEPTSLMNSAGQVGLGAAAGLTRWSGSKAGLLTISAAATASLVTFAKYETALLGIAKTANINIGPELDQLGNKFLDLSTKIPVTSTKLMEMAKMAAQFGVRGNDNLLLFAETLAKLQTATNIQGETGASDLARLIVVTRGNFADVKRYGSTLVALGNTTAATEAETLRFATRLAGSGAIFGMGATQALGLAAALRSLGVRAEMGSSSVQRALGTIDKVIQKSGAKRDIISKLTGINPDELQAAFKSDATGFLLKFTEGLGNAAKKGANLNAILTEIGLTGVYNFHTLGIMAKNADIVRQKIELAQTSFQQNTALDKEFNTRIGSLQSTWEIFVNKFTRLGVFLGAKLAPLAEILLKITGGAIDLITGQIGTPEVSQDSVMRREGPNWKSEMLKHPIDALLHPNLFGNKDSTVNGTITVKAEPGLSISNISSQSVGNSITLGRSMWDTQ